jgi:pSer/pThr/pTyr-binding forkhead associated (FHA) protein
MPGGAPASLRRLAPQEGEGEVIALSGNNYLLGRSHTCNIALLSATASRQHAEIVGRSGAWFLCPVGGKTLIADGRLVYGEIPLRHQMKIQLGADELLFMQENPDPDRLEREEETWVAGSAPVIQPPALPAEPSRSPLAWIALGLGAVLLAGLAFWLLL